MTALTTDVFRRTEAPTAFERWIDRLSLIFLCLYTFECAIGSSGRWLEIGPLSIRIILFAACFLVTLPAVFYHLRSLVRYPYVWVVAVFALWIGVAAWIGLRNGNDAAFIKADITGLLSLTLVPGFLATIRTPARVRLLTDVFFYSTAALAVVAVILHFALAFMSQQQITDINNWLNVKSIGGLADMSTGVIRIYFRSQMYLQMAIVAGMYRLMTTESRREKLWLYICEAFMVFAIVLTYTRGFWMGLALNFLLFAAVFFREWKTILRQIGVFVACLLVFLGLSYAVYGQPYAVAGIIERFDPNLIVIVSPKDPSESNPSHPSVSINNEPNDPFQAATSMRELTMLEQNRLIAESPIIGHGLGKEIDGRDWVTQGRNEYTYQDMWMKTGIIGLSLFLAVLGWHSVQQFGRMLSCRIKGGKGAARPYQDIHSPHALAWVWVCGMIGLLLTAYFNPFLTTPMGILVVMLTAAAVRRIPVSPADAATSGNTPVTDSPTADTSPAQAE